MKCVRCSAEIPAQSQFCLRCGTPLHTTVLPTSSAPTAAAFPAPRQSNRSLITAIVVLVLAVLGVAAFLVNSALTQKAAKSSGGQLVQAPGEGGSGSLVQAPGNSHSGAPVQAPADSNPNKVVQAPAPVIDTAEISDYLRFVKEIERRKQQMVTDFDARLSSIALKSFTGGIKEGIGGTENPDPSGDPNIKNVAPPGTGDLPKIIEGEFNRLSYDFKQKLPPQSCIDLRDRYYDHLGKLQSRLSKMAGIFAEIQTSPSDAYEKVKRMQGQSGDIDNSADSAERAHSEICKRFRLEKDFEIKGDQSTSDVKGLTGP